MKMTVISSFVIAGALAFAAGKTHKIQIAQDSVVEGKTLKAGEYKLSLADGNAVLTMGKESIEVPAHEVSQTTKNASDELIYKDGTTLEGVRFSGTNTEIVFQSASAPMQSGS